MAQYSEIPKNEQGNILHCFWQMLLQAEQDAWDSKNPLDRHAVKQYYDLWNRITGDNPKVAWEKG